MDQLGREDSNLHSERRIITVLAVDIVASTRHIADRDPEEAQALFDRCFYYLRAAIERAGGTMTSYIGDGGIATFGWPEALEDHAYRACVGAYEIQNGSRLGVGPNGRPILLRVGIHSGLVALRRLTTEGRSRLETVGATVHIAAKLQQCARPGEILVTPAVIRLCHVPLRMTPQPPSQPLRDLGITAFSLDASPEPLLEGDLANRYRSPMIGRESELATMRHMLLQRTSEGGAITLVGEPGIGKSRLATAAFRHAIGRDLGALVFFGDAQKRATPFAVARELLIRTLGPAMLDSPEALLVELGSRLTDPEDFAAAAALLFPGDALAPARAAQTETQLARGAARAFIVLIADRTTLLLIEDLHLVDLESRQFLRCLREASGRTLRLIVTSRPEALVDARTITGTVLCLEPLDRAAMKALARQLWPPDRIAGVLLERLVDRADGVPFILEELVHSCGGERHAVTETLPQGVSSLIHARLQRLSPGARVLAQTISLMGGRGDLDLVGDVVGADRVALSARLGELEQFAFTHPTIGRSASMRHQIIAEACAETVQRAARRTIHQAAIDALTARYQNLSGRHEQLAFHAEEAGDDAAALDYLWQAASEARRNSAMASLNMIFDRAIALIRRIGVAAEERYVDFVLAAFASMIQFGEFEKMNVHLSPVIALARGYGRPAQVCSTLSALGMMCWFEGRYHEGLQATEEGLALARSLGSPSLIFSNQIMRTNILHGMGRVDQAVREQRELCDLLSGALETARLSATGVAGATARSFLSWYLMDSGGYEEGLAHAEEALAIAQREADPYSEVLARNALGRNLVMVHRPAESAECLAAARMISERNGYDAIKAHLVGRSATALARCGGAAAAVALIEDCVRQRLHLRTGRLETYCLHAGHAEALWRIDRQQEALVALEQALGLARAIANPCLMVEALGLRARLLSEATPDDPRIAADLAEQAGLCARHGLVAWQIAHSSTTVRAVG